MSSLLVAPFVGLLATPVAWWLAAAVTEAAVGRRARRTAAWRQELADIDTWLEQIRAI